MQSNMIDVNSLREKEVPCYTSHLVPDHSIPWRDSHSTSDSLALVYFSMEEAKVVPALHLPTQGAMGDGGGWREAVGRREKGIEGFVNENISMENECNSSEPFHLPYSYLK